MELSLGAFSGFLVGNRRPMRLVPKWEASSDLEKRCGLVLCPTIRMLRGLCPTHESSSPLLLMESHEIILCACRKGD